MLTTLSQVQALSLDDARRGYPLRLKASVTYCDPEWMMMFIQDDTGCAYVERKRAFDDPLWLLRPGRVVVLDGVTAAGVAQPNVREIKLEVTDEVKLPVPVSLDSEVSFHSVSDARWVKATGVVTEIAGQLGTKSDLRFRVESGRTLRVRILNADLAKTETLRGFVLEVTGTFGLDLDAKGKPTGTNVIWAPGFEWIRKLRPIPLTPIGSLSVASASESRGLPIHIRGTAAGDNRGNYLLVRDSSGGVRADFDKPVRQPAAEPVEILGFPEKQDNVVVLKHSFLLGTNLSPAVVTAPAAASMPSRANTNLEELTRVIQIRNLSLAEALRGHPVRIAGVLTYSDPAKSVQFVQDNSGGIYVDLKNKQFDSLPGVRQWVEISGFSGPGEFAPVIEAEKLRTLGEGDFPPPNPAAIQTLMTGSQDSQWVSVDGIIRQQSMEDSNTVLTLSAGGVLVKVTVPNAASQPAPQNFEDDFVEIQGVCGTDFDDQRRLNSILFYVPGWEQVRVLDAAPRDAFALPVRPLSDLLRFQVAGGDIHRSHVRGVVSLRQDDGSFYLQDATGGVLVQPQKGAPPVKSGDVVELVGFPAALGKLTVLQEAVSRPAGRQEGLNPVQLPQDTPLREGLDGRLVQLQGEVLGHFTSTAQEWLSVQFGAWITDAVLEKNQPNDRLTKAPSGSIVRLTGVFVPRLDARRKIQSFQVLLRSPEDLTVIARPSWWTTRHAAWALATAGFVLALALAWVSLLRRQVQIQTRQLREEIEERKRMEAKMKSTHQELVTASRQAGMAEVATSVLHNVGNVLNSVNVSSSLLFDQVRQSRTRQVARVAESLREHSGDLGEYLTRDPKGILLVDYLGQLAGHLSAERDETLKELESLKGNIEHIKEIVAMQQHYARNLGGVLEKIAITQVVEDALRVNAEAFGRHHLELVRDFQANLPTITTDKHKVLQILVNLLGNAKYACDEGGPPGKRIVVRVRAEGGRIQIQVIDNGVGILPENLTRIFNYGFTTRKQGHGFGLHSGALAARELGGSLVAWSEGAGRGATFTLELPTDTTLASPSLS